MQRFVAVVPILAMSACAGGCSVARALYIAIVHNSGAPPREEMARLDQREVELARVLPSKRLLILPVAMLGPRVTYDTQGAASIAQQAREIRVARAIATTDSVVLPFEPQPNEAAILWSRFKALAEHVSAQPVGDVDYVMLVDVLGPANGRTVAAVHVMVVTARGEMAYRRLWNSHQPLFKEFRPATLDDVARMVVTDLSRSEEATPR
jgi:hypothetical protein